MRYSMLAAAFLLALPVNSVAFEAADHLDLNICTYSDANGLTQCLDDQIAICRAAAVEGEANGDGYAYWDERACDYVAFDQADQLLNDYYRFVVAGTRIIEAENAGTAYTGQEELLRESQRAWLKVRDLTCELDVAYGAIGPGADAAIAGCKARLTMERIGDLRVEIGHYLN